MRIAYLYVSHDTQYAYGLRSAVTGTALLLFKQVGRQPEIELEGHLIETESRHVLHVKGDAAMELFKGSHPLGSPLQLLKPPEAKETTNGYA